MINEIRPLDNPSYSTENRIDFDNMYYCTTWSKP